MNLILMTSQDSKVFRPINPMINGILSLLAELHSLKGLKINNVFCIELVFKAFSITAEDVTPTDLLKR
jgi:CCR4-NOT transcription complex subunit 1